MSGMETAFVAIGSVGFLVLVLSLVLGELGEHGFEAGHAELAHPELAHPEVGPHSPDTSSWLSSRVIAASTVGFGAAGYVAAAAGLPAWVSWPLAAVGFFAVGAGTFFLVVRPLAAQQYNSLLSQWNFVGRDAVVTLEIVAGGIGQVTFRDRQGARVTRTARSDTPAAIPPGAGVQIVDLQAGAVVVHHNSFSH